MAEGNRCEIRWYQAYAGGLQYQYERKKKNYRDTEAKSSRRGGKASKEKLTPRSGWAETALVLLWLKQTSKNRLKLRLM